MPKTPQQPPLVWQRTIRLPQEDADRVERLAAERRTPPAIVLRQLVKERLDQLDREKSP